MWGNKLERRNLYSMLDNEKYTGLYVYNKGKENEIIVKDGIPAIIDWEDFLETKKLRKQGNRRVGNKNHIYTLSEIAKCSCGQKLVGTSGTGRHGKTYYYYHCKKCKTYIPANKLEDPVFQFFMDCFLQDETIKEVARILEKELNEEVDYEEIERIENELLEVHGKIKNIVKVISEGISSEALQEELIKLEEEKDTLEFQKIKNQRLDYIDEKTIKDTLIKNRIKMKKSRQQLKAVYSRMIEELLYHEDNLPLTLVNQSNFAQVRAWRSKTYIFRTNHILIPISA